MKLSVSRLSLGILSMAVAAAGLVPAASATTYVMMSDEDLTDLAPAIVIARIVSRDPAPTLDLPATDYGIEINRVLKGNVPGSTLIVRVPGGMRSDGIGFHVFGAPRFDLDDRALLFLRPAKDGTFRIYHLMLGAFYEKRFRGERLAVRNFAETTEVEMPGRDRSEAERLRALAPRKLEAFTAWIADRVRGRLRDPDYLFRPSQDADELRSRIEAFRLFVDPDDRIKIRWFAFDQGETVGFRTNQDGQPGLTPQQLETAVRRGIAAWNSVSGTDIRYAFAGTTAASGGLTLNDGVNAVQFENPNDNGEFDGAYNCASGGVLAIGGPWYTSATFAGPGGEMFHRAVEGDIITNENIGCFFDASPDRQAAADELFGHELGHTLGIDHPCGDGESGPCDTFLEADALMRAGIHDDGRGARLNDDDRAAARILYPSGDVPGPAPPSDLLAEALSSTEVRLTWQDNSDDENSFEIEQRIGTRPFQRVATVGRDVTTLLLEGLQPETIYGYRVRARNAEGASLFSDPATVFTPPLAPDAPSDLRAVPSSATAVTLTWRDNSTDEVAFLVEMSSPAGPFQTALVTGAGVEQSVVSELDPATPYTFRVKAVGDSASSDYSNEASATTHELAPGPCTPDDRSLCLLDGRFQVRTQWRDAVSGDSGVGHAVEVPGSDLTGLFWFFDEDNIELVVKTLDATSFTGFYWNFYGALSNVEYWITVVDTDTQESVTYHNPQGEICGFPDTRAFPRPEAPAPASASSAPATDLAIGEPRTSLTARRLPEVTSLAEAGESTGGTCGPSSTSLCLLDNRFRVEVTWHDLRSGDQGVGRVRPVTTVDSDETGFFWFFDPNNVELVVKVLDARVINQHFWVFYGALSDVEYEVTVTDTVTEESLSFTNEFGDFCGDADTGTL